MKMITAISLSLLLFSCIDRGSETEQLYQLNQRVIRLEQRLDSLLGQRSSVPYGQDNKTSPGSFSYGTSRESARCLALTKKGSQCKRKAKSNGYCWQHGG